MKSVEVSQESSSAFGGAIENIVCSIFKAFSKRDNPLSLIWEEKIMEEFFKLSLEDKMYFTALLGIFVDMWDSYDPEEIKTLLGNLSSMLLNQIDFSKFEWWEGKERGVKLWGKWDEETNKSLKASTLTQQERERLEREIDARVMDATYWPSIRLATNF